VSKLGRKRNMGAMLLLIVLVLIISACSNSSSKTSDDKAQLVVVNWKDHGSDNPEAVQQFEEICECEVVHQYMASEEELLTKLRTVGSELDVVLPNSSILPKAIEEGLLEEIDTDKLENYEFLNKTLTDLPEMSMDGKTFAVPWVWGSTSLAYNPELVEGEVDSIQILFDKKYQGKVSIRDDFNDAVMISAMAIGESDPSHPTDLEAIKEKLMEQKELNKTYWKSGEEFNQMFSSKQVVAALAWSGLASEMKKEGLPIEYIIPKEGAIGWVDSWAIVKDTENKELAEKFIDFMISKEWQEYLAKNLGLAPSNMETVQSLDEEFIKENNFDEETLNKLHFITYHTDDEKKAWNEMWQEVKAK